MQYHVDEFSAMDLRHTIAEGWRIVRSRRWWLIIPGCLIATAALITSHWVPRKYTAVSHVERRNDPILAGILGSRWTAAYEDQRRTLSNDLRDRQAILGILDELDLPQGLRRTPDGKPDGPAGRRDAFAEQVIGGISSRVLETAPNRDLIEVSLTLDDPTFAPALTNRIRDTYIQRTRRTTVNVLQDARSFFEREADRCAAALREVEKKVGEYELKYPGINAAIPDPTAARRDRLFEERGEHLKQLNVLQRERRHVAGELQQTRDGETEAVAKANPTPSKRMRPNPRHGEIQGEMRRLEEEIKHGKQQRAMTDQHPMIANNRTKIARLRKELATLPAFVEDEEEDAPAPGMTTEQRLAARLADLDRGIADRQSMLALIEAQFDELRVLQEQGLEHRPEYEKLRAHSDSIRGELDGWRGQIGPINHVLAVENKNRGIHFSTELEATTVSKPSYPDALIVIAICLGIGLGTGALCVIIRELVDHSYRTAKQLTTSLGVPVIETIDEIITRAARRRRMVRGLVLMPALALLLVCAVTLAGAAVYLSLERPADFHRIRTMPAKDSISVLSMVR